MSRPTKLSAWHTIAFPSMRLCSLEHSHPNVSLWPTLRRMLALVMVFVLLQGWWGELSAEQAPLQVGRAQEDDSGQLHSEEAGYPGQAYASVDGDSQPRSEQVMQPLDAERLEQLVAPIALYPDTLVALVLTASTYPAQVAEADRWRQMEGFASSEQVAAGADAQNWDPSIKALTAFPQVLAQMAQNLPWTTDLGNAYYNQPSDTLEAVQVMRRRAQAAGNLEATPQEAVNYVGGYIQLAPVNPQLIYVPTFNPWIVYGAPVSPYPGFSLVTTLGSFLASSVVHFGIGIALTAFTRMPWGLLAWGLSWLAQAVLFHNTNYYSHSTTVADWGLPRGGLRAASQAFPGAGNRYHGFGGGYRPAPEIASVPRPANGYHYPGGEYGPGRAPAFRMHRPTKGEQELVPRPPNREPEPGGGYNAHEFVPRPPSSYSGYHPVERSSRTDPGLGYARAPRQNYLSTAHRPPPDERALTTRRQRSRLGQSFSAESGSRGFARSHSEQARSNGFHPFGGAHRAERLQAGGHAPKMKGGKGYNRHSGGGGHSGGRSSG
ncbi:MAG TPA: DUF3300 domain-containing protein, partial [Terriglobales bacterium]|nr:DUF3300 domain-containing protein [Terriglobales bacterium]